MTITYFADRVKETTLTTGTGPLVLEGAATGFMSIDDAMGSGQGWFCCTDGTDWEVFQGYLDGNGDLVRDYCSGSSIDWDFIDWGAGTKEVFNVISAEAIQYLQSVVAETMETPVIEDDHGKNGVIFYATAGETLAFGDDCYLKSDSKFWKADATDVTKNGMHVLALSSASAEGTVALLKRGFVRDDSWDWTPGATLYTPTVPGNPSETSGGYEKKIAYAYSANILYYCPGME